MTSQLLGLLERKPAPRVAWASAIFVTTLWGVLRLVVFNTIVFPLTYAIPLLLCVWTCNVTMLWLMAAAYAAMHTVQQFWILPAGAQLSWADWATYGATLFNVVVAALIVHAIIVLRERLARAFADVSAQADELQRLNEELTQQGEELSTQVEELTEQSEEIAAQNEELQTQSVEIAELSAELNRREALLQTLLDCVRLSHSETAAMNRICEAAIDLVGSPVAAAAIVEQQGNGFVLRGAAGFVERTRTTQPETDGFAALVIDQGRTACLDDLSLRPDLHILDAAARQGMKAILSAPLQREDRPFGALCVYAAEPHQWSAPQFRLAEWIASQAVHILEIVRLQRTLQRQAAIIDLTPDAIITKRMDDQITLWSRGAEVLYGWTKEEAVGASTQTLLHTRFPQPMSAIEAELERVGHWTGELTHRTKAGREVVVESRWLAQRDASGAIAELLESNVDITDRKHNEQMLRDVDRRKTEFLATLSHELRNPLSAMKYALSLLHTPAGAGSQPAVILERQLAHLVRLVDDLLDVSRVMHNKIHLRCEHVDLSSIVTQAVEPMRSDIEAARQTLDISLPEAPVWVLGDAVRLTQVLTNLLTNATRCTPPGGRIHVAASADGNGALVTVTDTGVGLDRRDLGRVFDLFAQVGEAHNGGLGIGLSIVREIVDLHKGRVEAHSAGRGRGAQFRVWLPVTEAPRVAAAPADAKPDGASCARILVVDDNQDAADLMKILLELDGHEVSIAYDPVAALRLAGERPHDIALLDIGLPVMNGYQLAEKLRATPGAGNMHLIAVTGWGQAADREKARSSGFNAHLTKPADPDALRTLIRTVMLGTQT